MIAPARERVNDAALIEQSWHEPETFAELYDRHAAPIHRYVTRRLGDGAADDIVAETFLVAFGSRHRYDLARSDARPWLYGIAANVIGKHRRTEVRMLRAFARTGIDPAAEGHADRIDNRVAAARDATGSRGCDGPVDGRRRDVLLLIAWADFSYDEVAVALGIPIGTVRSRLNRARRKVREALGGQDPTSLREELFNE